VRRAPSPGKRMAIRDSTSLPLRGTRWYGLWQALFSELGARILMKPPAWRILATSTLYISGVKVNFDLCASRYFTLHLFRAPALAGGEWRGIRLGLPRTALRWLGYVRRGEAR
jgi:hypothetical protein